MPGVGGLIAGFGSWLIGGTSVANAVLSGVISIGLSVASRLLQGKPKFGKGKNENSLTLTVRNSTEPRRLAYGRTAVPILEGHIETSGNESQILHYVGILCEGPIQEIEKIYFDDYELQLDSDGYEVGDYKNIVQVRKYLGEWEDDVDAKLSFPNGPVFEATWWNGFVSSGGKVSQFGPFVQGTGADQPNDSTVYISPNSDDGTSDYDWMSAEDNYQFVTGDFELVVRATLDLDQNNRTRPLFTKWVNSGGADRVFLLRWDGVANVMEFFVGDSGGTDSITVAATAATQLDIVASYDESAGTIYLSVNGSTNSKSTTINPDISRNVDYGLGTYMDSLGSFPDITSSRKTWRGSIKGVALYNKVLTSGERTEAFTFLDNYGVDTSAGYLTYSAGDVREGDLILLTGSPPTGFSAATKYYAIDVSASSFRLSDSIDSKTAEVPSGSVTSRFGITKLLVDAVLENESTVFDQTFKYSRIAYIALRMEFRQKKFPNGMPNVWCVVKGFKNIYDPRDGTTGYSTNVALCANHYLTTYTTATANTARLISAANECDTTVSLKAGGSETRYTANGLITLDENPEDIINRFCAAMGGWWIKTEGQVFFYTSKYITPTFTLTEEMVVGPVTISHRKPRRDRVNTIKGTYISEQTSWQPFSFPAKSNASYVTADGETHYDDIEMLLTESGSMVQRLAKIELESARQEGTLSLTAHLAALEAVSGEPIYVNLPRYGLNNAIYIVLNSTLTFPEGVVELSLQEYSSTIESWTPASDEETIYIPTNTVNNEPTVSDITINAYPANPVFLLEPETPNFAFSSNDLVSDWFDSSPNGNDAAQTTVANQPHLLEGGIVGDSGDDRYMDFASALIPSTGDFMAIVLVKTPSTTAASESFSPLAQYAASGSGRFELRYDGATKVMALRINDTTVVSETLSTLNIRYGVVIYRDGTTFGLRSSAGASWQTATDSTGLLTTGVVTQIGNSAGTDTMLSLGSKVSGVALWEYYADTSRDRLLQIAKMNSGVSFTATLETALRRADIWYSKEAPPIGATAVGNVYTRPVSVSSTEYIYARGYAEGYEPSLLASFSNADPYTDFGLSSLRLMLNDRGQYLKVTSGVVTEWDDASFGGSFAVYSPTGSPLAKYNILNTHAVVNFDGVDDFFHWSAGSVLSGNTARTFFFVARSDVASSSNFNPIYDLYDAASPGTGAPFSICFRRNLEIHTNGGYQRWQTAIENNTWVLLTIRWNGRRLGQDGGTQVRVNGRSVKFLGSQGSNTTINTGTAASSVGRSRWLGNDEYFKGDVAEILVFNDNLTVDEAQLVESYLIAKFQLDLIT